MSNVKDRAEAKAENYVKYALGDMAEQQEAFTAKEDFMAGYLAGAELNKSVIDFCRSQLQFIHKIAGEKGETQTQALIRYVIDRIK